MQPCNYAPVKPRGTSINLLSMFWYKFFELKIHSSLYLGYFDLSCIIISLFFSRQFSDIIGIYSMFSHQFSLPFLSKICKQKSNFYSAKNSKLLSSHFFVLILDLWARLSYLASPAHYKGGDALCFVSSPLPN